MIPETLLKSDIQLVITGVALLLLGAILIIIAVTIYKRVRDLLSATSKSEAELEGKVKAKTKEVEILHDLTSVISQSLKVKEILKPALSKVIEIADAQGGMAHIVSKNSSGLDLVITEKLPAELTLRLIKIKPSYESAVFAAGKTAVKIIDIENSVSDEFINTISSYGFQQMMSILIVFKGVVLGAITLVSKKNKAFTEQKDTFPLFQSIGMEVGVALNNALLFEKVENAKTEWESTFDSIKDLVCIHDRDFKILRCNISFAEYVGLKITEIAGREYFKTFPKKGLRLNPSEVGSLEKEDGSGEIIMDGDTGRVFLINTYPVFNSGGEYVYSVRSAKDITEIKQAKEDLENLLIGTITTLVSVIDAKSPWTKGHSERVTSYAKKIAHDLKLDNEWIETLTLGGLLHDIGKIGTYDTVLDKAGPLTPEEYELVKKHPQKGADILAPIKQLKNVVPIIKHHHERYNGEGYPDGLKGEAIPIGARILSVADSFDAMVSDRPYRKSSSREYAFLRLKELSGVFFDPKIVEIFLKAAEQEDFFTNP
jgi:putative nucleotidyltransferase with HDIG domain/PAS domain S-box-containing protein